MPGLQDVGAAVGLLDQAVDHRRVLEDRLPLPQCRRLPLVHGRQLRPLGRPPCSRAGLPNGLRPLACPCPRPSLRPESLLQLRGRRLPASARVKEVPQASSTGYRVPGTRTSRPAVRATGPARIIGLARRRRPAAPKALARGGSRGGEAAAGGHEGCLPAFAWSLRHAGAELS